MTKKLTSILAIFFFSFGHCFAQETITVKQLQTAHQEAQDALQKMRAHGIDGLQILEVIGGGVLAGGLLYAAGKGISSLSMKEQAQNYTALFVEQEKLGRSGPYLAKQLGEENVRLLQNMLKKWKKTYVYEVPVLISEPWQRSFYVIKPECTQAFLKHTSRLWNEHLAQIQIKADTRLYGMRGLGDITWNAVADFNEKLVLALEEKGALASYVDKFTTVSQARTFAASRKDLLAGTLKYKNSFSLAKVFSKSTMKKLALVAVLAAVWQVAAGADEQRILERVDKNPAILFQLTQQEAASLADWPELAQRYVASSALLSAAAQLPPAQQEILYQQVQKKNKEQRRQVQQELVRQLKTVSTY